ncbi:phosphoglycerate mutase-like protein [Coprinopsis marcescibilis]|uniref:Phosphoglycerate mutase-like protein n=1 Tax=Coprinopsis marcescibilis TaxID=230819 RepID=A0A5C3LE47_COPMA|nr:phosphoglycerate mutase-like protein [Coprinopsis marcescibilis]
MPRVRVHLARHGETAENRLRIFQGQLDTQLNEEGLTQARILAEALKDVPFSLGFASDLSRAKKTASEVLRIHPNSVLTTDSRLRERFMGNLQGLEFTKERVRSIAKDDTIESKEELSKRGIDWWKSTIIPLAIPQTRSGENSIETVEVLAVSHGAFILTLLNSMLQEGLATYAYQLPLAQCLNTSISILELESLEAPAVLVKHADIGHLLKPRVQEVVQDNVDDVAIGGSKSE